MFQINMSPKVLNAEKLDKKFASLTKSKESILGLSTWIIHYKEFYREIVDQWLDALSKDMNALTMFYVANDVIQNCGRKKAPEFREAFATVLEKAVSLEKVKKIKADVIRMFTLWQERSIYDAVFYKKLQDILNDVEESESEEEPEKADVISNFKLENLTDSLQKLKPLEEELLDKEEFLEDIEEPGITNIDNLIVKMDSQKELRKVDKFQKLIESYISLADKMMAAQKDTLLNLKYSSIFYSAQLEDAKKVAHAYRIYGKKVKMVEKALIEKLANLPEASPIIEENSPDMESNSNLECQSPGLSVIFDGNNENSIPDISFDLNRSSQMNENDSFINENIVNEKYKSPLTESLPAFPKSLSSESKIEKKPTVVSISINVKEDVKTIESPIIVEAANVSMNEISLKSPSIDNVSKKSDKIHVNPIIVDVANSETAVDVSRNLNREKILKSPLIAEKVRRISADQNSKSPVIVEKVTRSSTDQHSKSPVIVEKIKRTITEQNSKSPVIVEKVKRTSTEQNSKSPVIVEKVKRITAEQNTKSPVLIEKVKRTTTEQNSKSPVIVEKVKRTTTEQNSKSPVIVEKVKSNIDKISKCITTAASDNTSVSDKTTNSLEEKKFKSSSDGGESTAKKICSSENEEILSAFKESSEAPEDLQTFSEIENIDFLLEKAYNKQRTKSKASFKRKIDNLLKMKQSKACKFSSSDSVQDNINALEMSVAEDSAIVSCSNVDSGNKDDSDSIMIKEENTVNAESFEGTEKVSLTPNSEQINDNEPKQSLKMITNSKASDGTTTTENIPLSTTVPFSNFPDIPTELLKNILDKHRTNMNHFPTLESCSFSSELPDHKSENVKLSDLNQNLSDQKTEEEKLSDSNQNNLICNSTANDKKSHPSAVDCVPTLDSNINVIEDNIQEKVIQDNESKVNINKDDIKFGIENVTKTCTEKTTPLMENLQKLLRCFTEKGPAFNELKNSNTLKTLPTMSLKSTLKLYHVLKQHHQNVIPLNSSIVDNNSLPSFQPATTSTVDNKSSVCNYNSTNTFVHSKNDNLEIMDMEVDSDDDSMK